MSDTVVSTSVPLDGMNDPSVLADLLAFLDGFEATEGGNGAAAESAVARAESGAPDTEDRQSNPPRVRRRQTRAVAKNRARVERYWLKKDELQSMRRQVAQLAGKLERMKTDAASSLVVTSTTGLRVTMGRVRGARGARVDWKQRAARERELRLRSEAANAQLRELVRKHMMWGSGLGMHLRMTWPIVTEGCRIEPVIRNSRSACEEREELWDSILHQLSEEASTLRGVSVYRPVEQVEPLGEDPDDVLSTPLMEWKSSFFVPDENPQRVGRLWWNVLRQQFLSPGSGVDAVMKDREGACPRVEKRAVWSVMDDDNCELRLSTIAMFEVTDTHSHWTLAATSDVLDAARDEVLFRTSTIKVVTQTRTSMSPSCVFRSRYRVHGMRSSSAERPSSEEVLDQLRRRELAMCAWVDMMRNKDQNVRRVLMEQCR